MSREKLAEFVWPYPPVSVEANLRTHIATLRRSLESAACGLGERIETARGEGLRLCTETNEIDGHRFVRLATQGNRELRAGRNRQAAEALAEGLGLWHGAVGVDLPDTLPFREQFDRLDRARRVALADLCEARLRLAEATLIINDLHELLLESPLSERPVGLLMQALCAAGDSAAALAAYHRYRRTLSEETGAHPSADLEALYIQILRDPGAGDRQRPVHMSGCRTKDAERSR